MKKHTHRIYGNGPNKELEFKKTIQHETECNRCIHNKVCSHVMDKRCVNHTFSSNLNIGTCQSCIHHYTRFDKDPVPCFHCDDFLEKNPIDLTNDRPMMIQMDEI